jgi:hypothetical protein
MVRAWAIAQRCGSAMESTWAVVTASIYGRCVPALHMRARETLLKEIMAW